MASRTAPKGTLALIGGGEWGEHHQALDRRLLAISGGTEVVVLPTAASYEHPEQVGQAAVDHFSPLGATVTTLPVVNRRDAENAEYVEAVERATFVYLADGSPMHLRSVLKSSDLYEALLSAYRRGAVVAASGAGATVLCDPMVDPRGGAYTVGLGFVTGLAVFPYHGTAARHLLERSIELKPRDAILVGLDEETALVRAPDATWSVAGRGHATVYGDTGPTTYAEGATGLALP
ncbi:MAG: Type 1 glutamine amidotransferase-like domain-containing protein [Acidimicrobiia bacterium]|nr:Type 1 glutamine amidotransferase-like domain-containing protein [Acidimicrobiia bacterium]